MQNGSKAAAMAGRVPSAPLMRRGWTDRAAFVWLAALMAVAVVVAGCVSGRSEALANNRGNESFESENFDQAIAEYESVQEDAPDQAEPFYNAANAQYRKGDYEASHEEMQSALLNADEDLTSKARFNQGNTYYQVEEYEDALESYREVLRNNPDDADAKHNLELVLRKIEEERRQEQQQEQQQQQQQGQQEQPGPQDQPNDEGEGERETPESEREGMGEDPEGEQQGDGSEQENERQERPGPNPQPQLTPGQARQLLDSVGQNTESLQSYLQRQFMAPGRIPERDW